MKRQAFLSPFLTAVLFTTCAICAAQGIKPKSIYLGARPPVIAMWQHADGWQYRPPQLRFAIWGDGRFLVASKSVAANPDAWSTRLEEGHISAEQLAALKQRVAATGAFGLKHPSLVIPDSAFDNLMVNFGDKKQLLEFNFWALSMRGEPGIGKDPDVAKLVKCWTAIDQIVIASRPKNSKRVNGSCESIPVSWYVKIGR